MKYAALPYSIFNLLMAVILISYSSGRTNWLIEPDYTGIFFFLLFLICAIVLGITLPMLYNFSFKPLITRKILIFFLILQAIQYIIIAIEYFIDDQEYFSLIQLYPFALPIVLNALFLGDIRKHFLGKQR